MKLNRRTFIGSGGAALALPALECFGAPASPSAAATRCLIVGNPFGMHPQNFFPKSFGRSPKLPFTLQPLQWLNDRLTVISNTDHDMGNGHGKEVSFLSGILPSEANAYAEKNISFDQVLARYLGSDVRYPSIHVGLKGGIQMSWTANGTIAPVTTDPKQLYANLFTTLDAKAKARQVTEINRNQSVLENVADQLTDLKKSASQFDRDRLDQFQTSIREFEQSLEKRGHWVDRDKPAYDLSAHYSNGEHLIHNDYEAIFDMNTYAFETNLTRIATVAFPRTLEYTDIDGVSRGYHSVTHNGKSRDIVNELLAIERFQIEHLSRCLKKLDAIPEPHQDGSMLDHTVVLFGSGMGYGGTHSCKKLPILVAGGGLKHLGHVNVRINGKNMPLCNLFLTLIQHFGIERDTFNVSTGTFNFG